MPLKAIITSVEGHTGCFAITELLLSDPFSTDVDSVVGLTLDFNVPKTKECEIQGAHIVQHVPGNENLTIQTLKENSCDALYLVPPAHADVKSIAIEPINVAKEAGIPNILLISSAGCDYVDPQKQPRWREFIDLEAMVLAAEGDESTNTGPSSCIIR